MSDGAPEPQPPAAARDGAASDSPVARSHFATTRWSIVLAAGASRDGTAPPAAAARDALAVLCRTYWYPLYAYTRHRGHRPEEAQDLTQAFFVRLLERDVLSAAEPRRGRFRSFLLTALKNFLINEWHRAHAEKRGGAAAAEPLSLDLDFDTAERRYAREPADTLTPERVYERGWALALLDQVLGDLRERYATEGKIDLFERLKPYLSGDDTSAPTYGETATASGTTEGAVQVAVHRLRKRYRDLLRRHIGETVEAPEEVDEEIRDLFRAVRA